MRRYEPRMEAVEYLEEWICDKCGKSIGDDDMVLQESLSIKFTGGYSSVFGDGNNIEVDVCQNCLKDMIGLFCRIT